MINLEVKLPDTPGSLAELIKPISENGGNIFGILHHHDKLNNNMIPVSISFELNEDLLEHNLKNIKSKLIEKKIEIDKITFGKEQNTIIVILTGHVFESDIVDTIKRLAKKKIITKELQARFTEITEVSNVKLKLEFPESMMKNEILDELDKICREKDLFLLKM